MLEVDEHGFDESIAGCCARLSTSSAAVRSASAVSPPRSARNATPSRTFTSHSSSRSGFLDRTPRGRVATPRAYEYFGLAAPGKDRCGEKSAVRVKVAGLSTYVPPRVLTNADLEKLVETSDEWILQRTGISERHIVDPGVATSDLAKEAARGAIASGRNDRRRTSASSSSARRRRTRFSRARRACCRHKIGASNAWGFDLGAACSGLHLRADDRRCRWWRPARTITRWWSAPT